MYRYFFFKIELRIAELKELKILVMVSPDLSQERKLKSITSTMNSSLQSSRVRPACCTDANGYAKSGVLVINLSPTSMVFPTVLLK